MFADDTNISCEGQSSTDIEYKLNGELGHCSQIIIIIFNLIQRTKFPS